MSSGLRTKELEIMLHLARRGAVGEIVKATTTSISQSLGIPQQTVSNALMRLEEGSLITRDGSRSKITKKGEDSLRELYRDCRASLRTKRSVVMRGEVVSGVGDGKYYMELDPYLEQFREKLGYEPHPGTLNISLEDLESIESKRDLMFSRGIDIEGFESDGRELGRARCYPCEVENGEKSAEGAVIIPERSHYGPEVLEVVSEFNLREKLNLEDGDEVTVRCKF